MQTFSELPRGHTWKNRQTNSWITISSHEVLWFLQSFQWKGETHIDSKHFHIPQTAVPSLCSKPCSESMRHMTLIDSELNQYARWCKNKVAKAARTLREGKENLPLFHRDLKIQELNHPYSFPYISILIPNFGIRVIFFFSELYPLWIPFIQMACLFVCFSQRGL